MRRGIRTLVMLGTGLPGLTIGVPRVLAQETPSFSCSAAATASERTICAVPTLAAADREMAKLHDLAKVGALGNGPSNIRDDQRRAVERIAACGATLPGKDEIASCIADAYAERSEALAIMVAIRDPGAALPVIRRNDPPFAAVIEAIGLWAAEPRDADWSSPVRAATRGRILGLLHGATTLMFGGKDAAYGRAIIAGTDDGVSVKNPGDLFRSDRHFALFLNALGPYLPDAQGSQAGRGFDRPIPCAAIVRHPALLRATASLFGSTLDNFVFRNDCDTALPPLPRLTAMLEALNRSWPTCEGTIRFAAYRMAMTAVDEARLGIAPHNADSDPRDRYAIPAGDVAAVRGELAAYYRTYLGRSPAAAGVMADNALKGIFATTHQCD